MKSSLNPFDWIALIIVIVGAINWGVIAVFELDLVAEALGEEFGTTTTISRIVYGVVGAAAIYMIITVVKYFPRKTAV